MAVKCCDCFCISYLLPSFFRVNYLQHFFLWQEEKWYSAALKEEVDKITKEKVELEEMNSLLEKVCFSCVYYCST